jgi:tRNA-splicing endonuclease subunit Sen2
LLQTLILTYVTIPARSRVSTQLLESPACLAHYSVREVVLRRFVPARMRD